MHLDANTRWFNFTVDGDSRFAVYAFTGEEEVHKPYEFVIELLSLSAEEDLVALTGKAACLTIADKSGALRPIHGIIRQMEQLHTANRHTHYRCHLVPRLWFLGQIVDHRIFQNKNVVEIILQVLSEQGFADEMLQFKLFYQYQPRDYCVQYGESDLHFISRLCEEEGIYFYFEHTEENHRLCFCDRENGPKIPGESCLRYYPGSGTMPDTAVISRLTLHQRVNSNASTYREWNFTRPHLNQEVTKDGPINAPVPDGMRLEQYRYPHLYQYPHKGGDPGTHGQQYVDVQLLRQTSFARWIEGESDVARFVPSYIFSVYDHPRPDVNESWWVVSAKHLGEQPQVLEHEAPDRGMRYTSSFVAIPHMTRFVPEVRHRKNRVDGVQTAIVTGPEGEEVYTDQFSRVKVQFHWDREGKYDENTSCWLRVSAGWAGNSFGFIHIPRIGQEVLVEFMEGDPDRPIITGRVYYATNMPPWNLAKQKTLSGIQSREFHAGRRNQLVLDDTKGEIQAQLSSDHNLSQLNLGYLTRVNHGEGRKDFRGEGFELRTDGWGAVRAAKGMYISTYPRTDANKHHKDMVEADSDLKEAVLRHEDQLRIGSAHNIYDAQDTKEVCDRLHKQSDDIHGTGEQHKELAAPHMVLASPAGLAIGTPQSVHVQTGAQVALTTGRHITLTSGRSLLAMVMDRVHVFAYKLGIKLFSGKGKIEIQAQDNDIEIIADQVLKLISAKRSIELTAAQEIILTGGTSYIRINNSGIEEGTKGKWQAKAGSHHFLGPTTLEPPLPQLPKLSACMQDAQKCARPACPVCGKKQEQ